MRRLLLVILVLAALAVWRDWSHREIVHPPGILVAEQPRQTAMAGAEALELDGYRLTRRARFEVRARVLSREDYRWGAEADLSPIDLALGWGVMSDQSVLDRIEITQGSRWYFTRYDLPAPIPDREIIRHSGNMHMVPAGRSVLSELRKVRKGDIVHARGYLIDVDHDSGFRWRTSLRRDDSGGGSCEIFYLEQFEIETRS